MQNKINIEKVENKYIVKTPRGLVVLNKPQYDILMCFSEKAVKVDTVYKKFNNIDIDKLRKLLSQFIFEKIIVDKDAAFYERKTLGYYYKRITSFELPKQPFLRILNPLAGSVNEGVGVILAILSILFSIYTNYELIKYTNFSWSNLPRLMLFFLMGIFISLFHEMCMAVFIIQYGGIHTLKFKLRVILGVFISIAVNWSYLLTVDKKKAIKTFLKADLFTLALSSLFSIIGFIFMMFNEKEIAFKLCSCSIVGYSYMAINLWPFLLKSDGYSMFCITNEVARVRPYFFRIIYSVITRKKIDFIPKSKLPAYLCWGVMFFFTLIFIEYALSKGIRLRI